MYLINMNFKTNTFESLNILILNHHHVIVQKNTPSENLFSDFVKIKIQQKLKSIIIQNSFVLENVNLY